MSVPKFYQFFNPFLKALSDGEIHTSKEVRSYIEVEMNLSDDDLSEMLPSGKTSCFYNRVNWARTYLDRAGLIETPFRGRYCLSAEGKRVLRSGDEVDVKYLGRYESFLSFQKREPNQNNSTEDIEEEEEKTPVEALDDAFRKVNDNLSDQLMSEVMKLSPFQFETLVVKLLLAMGYGDSFEQSGKVTQKSNDGGIDGIIREDKLGFSKIFIQAKQWAPSQTVGRQEIQKFVGALTGKQAQKGLFITTAKYSSGAKNYAENLLGTKVVLVDGEELAKLMIKHNVGVSVEHTYEVKKIDSDFFEDEV